MNCEMLRGAHFAPSHTFSALPCPLLGQVRPGLLKCVPGEAENHCAVGDRASVAARSSVCSSRELLLH